MDRQNSKLELGVDGLHRIMEITMPNIDVCPQPPPPRPLTLIRKFDTDCEVSSQKSNGSKDAAAAAVQ